MEIILTWICTCNSFDATPVPPKHENNGPLRIIHFWGNYRWNLRIRLSAKKNFLTHACACCHPYSMSKFKLIFLAMTQVHLFDIPEQPYKLVVNITISNSYSTLIRVHEMHCQCTPIKVLQLVWWPMTPPSYPLPYPMIIHTPLIACNLPLKNYSCQAMAFNDHYGLHSDYVGCAYHMATV